jgi:hypothetical protein
MQNIFHSTFLNQTQLFGFVRSREAWLRTEFFVRSREAWLQTDFFFFLVANCIFLFVAVRHGYEQNFPFVAVRHGYEQNFKKWYGYP